MKIYIHIVQVPPLALELYIFLHMILRNIIRKEIYVFEIREKLDIVAKKLPLRYGRQVFRI
jgi:hypothetical protein